MKHATPRDILILPLAAVVAGAWVASLVAGMFEQSFVALEVTTPVMLILVGYVFGVQIVKGASGGKNEGH